MKNVFIAIATITAMSCMAQTPPPAAVQAAFTKNFPGINVKKWDKEKNNFEAEFTKDGRKMTAIFDAKGTWKETETDIAVMELPAVVTDYIRKNYNGAAAKEAALIKTPEGEMYEAEVNGKDLLFDKQGKFIKEEQEEDDEEDED